MTCADAADVTKVSAPANVRTFVVQAIYGLHKSCVHARPKRAGVHFRRGPTLGASLSGNSHCQGNEGKVISFPRSKRIRVPPFDGLRSTKKRSGTRHASFRCGRAHRIDGGWCDNFCASWETTLKPRDNGQKNTRLVPGEPSGRGSDARRRQPTIAVSYLACACRRAHRSIDQSSEAFVVRSLASIRPSARAP
jgi:hypothetical protein